MARLTPQFENLRHSIKVSNFDQTATGLLAILVNRGERECQVRREWNPGEDSLPPEVSRRNAVPFNREMMTVQASPLTKQIHL